MTFEELLTEWNAGLARGAQTKLAEKVGVAPNTVSQWVRGVSQPAGDLRPRVAKELGVTPEQLREIFLLRRIGEERARKAWALEAFSDGGAGALREGGAPWPGKGHRFIDVPVYGPTKARRFPARLLKSPPDDYLPLAVKGPVDARYGALKVQGNALEPLARDGDHILFAETAQAVDGKWALVLMGDECFFSKVSFRKNGVELTAEGKNSRAATVTPGKLHIAGVVVGRYAKL